VRIIRGFLKARRFSPPKNFPSRPTTDFAKEGLFNVLENSVSLYKLEILDLCAGTGNISYEFASREAGNITSVEQNFYCVRFMQQMIKEHKLEQVMHVFKSDVRDFVRKSEKSHDLIFFDPPYEVEFYHDLISTIFERNILKENGLLVVEHGKKTSFANYPSFEKEKVYGNVHFSFLKHPSYENE